MVSIATHQGDPGANIAGVSNDIGHCRNHGYHCNHVLGKSNSPPLDCGSVVNNDLAAGPWEIFHGIANALKAVFENIVDLRLIGLYEDPVNQPFIQ